MPPRDQPIDPAAIGRDQMILMLGKLVASAEQALVERARLDKKLDDLGGNVVRLENTVERYIITDKSEHDKLSEKITRIVQILGDEETDLGLVPRLRKVENAMSAQKNLARGAIVGGIIGGGSGVFSLLNSLAKRFGWW